MSGVLCSVGVVVLAAVLSSVDEMGRWGFCRCPVSLFCPVLAGDGMRKMMAGW